MLPQLPALPRARTVLLLVDLINPLDFDGAERLAPAALQAATAAAALKRDAARLKPRSDMRPCWPGWRAR